MQNSLGFAEIQKSEIRQKISEMREEVHRANEVKDEELGLIRKMDIEEQQAMKDIENLQKEIKELHLKMEEQKIQLKFEDEELMKIEPGLREKREELENLKIAALDENEIKTVLNERIRGIEENGEVVLREISDFENRINDLRGNQNKIQSAIDEEKAEKKF